MPDFQINEFATPFGRNVFLRSTDRYLTESRTFAKETLPTVTIDGHPNQKVLQPGMVLAKIASGPDVGKVGPFQDAGSGANEVQTLTEGTAITAGTFDMTILGVTITAIPFDVTAAALQASIRAAVADSENLEYAEYSDSLTVAGGPVGTTPFTITFVGAEGRDVPAITVDVTDLTGTITVATTTAGVAGATDGRGVAANIVGVCNTFLPWQLIHRDVEVAVIYSAAVYQARCFKLNAAGIAVPLDDTTAAAMVGKKNLDFTFHTRTTEIGDN